MYRIDYYGFFAESGDVLKVLEMLKKVDKKAWIALAVCLSLIIGIIVFDIAKKSKEYQTTTVAMGTIINIRLFGPDGEETAQLVIENINETERALLSRNETSSDVDRINKSPNTSVSVSYETVDIIEKALEVSQKSGGVFDITVGEITKLWDFEAENPTVPTKEEIEKHLPHVGSASVEITETTVRIDNGQSLDLGAVGKGAACDRIKTLLETTKTDSAVISVGGSLLLYGDREFKIGIANPENSQTTLGTLELSEVFISTSGNYEKCFEADGKTYHHILDATTGYPADSRLASVTVVCDSGVLSDALSTACYILGYEDSLALLNEYNAQAVFVFKDKTIRVTDGLKEKFTLTDESFMVGK